MRHKDIAKCGLAVLLFAANAIGQTFEQNFLSPPEDARVMMRWWWFGPSVTRPELLREMQQMKAGGIGGFEIQPVYPLALDDPQTGFRNFPYLSDEFLQDVRYANDEATKLGLRVSLTLSSGWPYGGPNTPVTEAAGAITSRDESDRRRGDFDRVARAWLPANRSRLFLLPMPIGARKLLS